jgi:hypothetical protein
MQPSLLCARSSFPSIPSIVAKPLSLYRPGALLGLGLAAPRHLVRTGVGLMALPLAPVSA